MEQFSRGTSGGRLLVFDCQDEAIASAVVFPESGKTEPPKDMLLENLDSPDQRLIHMREIVHGV
jgi:hypothetical protein